MRAPVEPAILAGKRVLFVMAADLFNHKGHFDAGAGAKMPDHREALEMLYCMLNCNNITEQL